MEKLIKTIECDWGTKFKAGFLSIHKIKETKNSTYYELDGFKGIFKPWADNYELPFKKYRIKHETEGVDILYVGRKKYWLLAYKDYLINLRLFALGDGIYALCCFSEDNDVTMFFIDGINPYQFIAFLTHYKKAKDFLNKFFPDGAKYSRDAEMHLKWWEVSDS